jgi:hypothetical protein
LSRQADLPQPVQGFAGTEDSEWRSIRIDSAALTRNEGDAAHVVAMVVGEQHLIELACQHAHSGALTHDRVTGAGIQQQPGAVGAVDDDGGVGSINAVPGSRAEKRDSYIWQC